MAKSKSASAAADHKHEDLVKEIAALKKQVVDLKKELAKKSADGADPRVDKVIEVLLTNAPLAHKLKKIGLV